MNEVVFIYRHSGNFDSVREIRLQVDGDASIDEMLDAFSRFCLACGYSPASVAGHIKSESSKFEGGDDDE